MHPSSLRGLTLAAGIFLLAGCRSIPPPKGTSFASPPDQVQSGQAVEAYARYLTGWSQQINDQPEEAARSFYQAAQALPESETLALEAATRALQQRDFPKAVGLLSKAAANTNCSAVVPTFLAHACLQSGLTNAALAALDLAIQKTPGALGGYQSAAEICFQTGQTNLGLKTLDRAAQQTFQDPQVLVNLADLYVRQVSLARLSQETVTPRVRALQQRARALNPINTGLLQRMADNYETLEAFPDAAELLVQVLDIVKEPPLLRDALREKLANLYVKQDAVPQAIAQLELIIKENPTRYPTAYHHLGKLHLSQTNHAQAEANFLTALRLNPENEQAYYDLAVLRINLDRPDDTLDILNQSKNHFPDSFLREFLTGTAYSYKKDYPQALKHYIAAEVRAKATDSRRLNHAFYYRLAATYERVHDYEQSEKYFQKCLELEPRDAETLNYLGYMWADRGTRLPEARDFIARALEIDPQNAAILDSMGWVLFKLGRPREALPYLLDSARLMEKPDPTLFDHLGEVYLALQDPAKARESWRRSLEIEPNDTIRQKLEALP